MKLLLLQVHSSRLQLVSVWPAQTSLLLLLPLGGRLSSERVPLPRAVFPLSFVVEEEEEKENHPTFFTS